jgi:hypothetical protein
MLKFSDQKEPIMSDMKQVQKTDSNTMKFIVLAAVGFLVAAILVVAFMLNQTNNDSAATAEQEVANQNLEESVRVIDSLNGVLLTDSEAEPTVARVEDPEILRQANQDFYKNAAIGDYLVLYPQRAVLYREADRLIINVAPIINSEQLTSGTSAGTQTLPVAE